MPTLSATPSLLYLAPHIQGRRDTHLHGRQRVRFEDLPFSTYLVTIFRRVLGPSVVLGIYPFLDKLDNTL